MNPLEQEADEVTHAERVRWQADILRSEVAHDLCSAENLINEWIADPVRILAFMLQDHVTGKENTLLDALIRRVAEQRVEKIKW